MSRAASRPRSKTPRPMTPRTRALRPMTPRAFHSGESAAEKPQDKLSAATAAANFQSAFDEFKSYLARLRSLQSQFQVAEPEARQKIVDEFNDCVARCNQVVPRLQTSAVQAFEADPANRKAGDFLMANLVDAVESDRHWDGARLAKILADGGYPEKAFFNYAGIAEYGNQDFTQAKTDFANAQRVNIINKVAKEKCLPFVEECIPLWEAEKVVRAAEEEADDLPRVRLTTTKGDIVVELFENEAPNTTANFISLVERHFYDGTKFHRVLTNFMAQGGDPNGNGSGGPDYTIACECHQPNRRNHFAGSLSMAHGGRDTGGSQFFLNFMPTPGLNGKHTVFGRVIEGMGTLASLQRMDPDHPDPGATPDEIVKATVIRKRDHAYEPVTVAKPQPGK